MQLIHKGDHRQSLMSSTDLGRVSNRAMALFSEIEQLHVSGGNFTQIINNRM